MKRIRINEGTVGLVYRKAAYRRVLTQGTYWLTPREWVRIYNMARPFVTEVELNLLLRDDALARLLTIVHVADNEIVLLYEDGLFKRVLAPGKYAFWKGLIDYTFTTVDLTKIKVDENIDPRVLQKPEVVFYIRVYPVESYEKGILMIDGKFDRILDPGVYYFWKNATPVTVLKADLRQLQLEIPGQEILTRDKAALRINFYTQYQVVDIQKALLNSKDYEKQLYVLMQLALREYVGMLTLDELLERKTVVADSILEAVAESAAKIGVVITESGIRDIILPGDVKDIMNQVLVAEKTAQANTITRREETASTRSLLNTAKLMEDNTMLYKLKEMEYVEKIADKINRISLSGGSQVLDQLRDIFTPEL
jgi:regulator of protease activity HflC (stomatin/prohibitin superfamily)